MYSPKEFSQLLNVSVKTLQRWDREGVLPAKRNPKNRRYYTEDDLRKYKGETKDTGKVVVYCRVSTRNQKDDLENQVDFLMHYCTSVGQIVDVVYKDFGSGLNYNRKFFNKVLEDACKGEINKLYISHRDRFVRFGWEWFHSFLQSNGVEVVVVNDERSSPQEELVEDIISILHVFSCRLYGLRKYKGKIKDDKSLQSGAEPDGNSETKG
jgi:putative resolvase